MASPLGGIDYKSLIAAKEAELHSINEFRLQQLESLLATKDSELLDLRNRLERIREDYAYNLSLFESRDAELARLEAQVREQGSALSAAQGEAGRWRGEAESSRARSQELESFHESQLRELREGIAAARAAREEEMARWRAQGEALRSGAEAAVREAGERADASVREAAEAAEAAVAAARRAARRCEEEAAAAVRAAEERSAAAVGSAQEAGAAAERERSAAATLQRALDDATAELSRVRADGEARAREWEARALAAERDREAALAARRRLGEEYEARMGEVCSSLRACEGAFAAHKAHAEEREAAAREAAAARLREAREEGEALLGRERASSAASLSAAEHARLSIVASLEVAQRALAAERAARAGEAEATAAALAAERARAAQLEARASASDASMESASAGLVGARAELAAVQMQVQRLEARWAAAAEEADARERAAAGVVRGVEESRDAAVGALGALKGELEGERRGREEALKRLEEAEARAGVAQAALAQLQALHETPMAAGRLDGGGGGAGVGVGRSAIAPLDASSRADSMGSGGGGSSGNGGGVSNSIAARSARAIAAVAAAEEALEGLDALGSLEAELAAARASCAALGEDVRGQASQITALMLERDRLVEAKEALRVRVEAAEAGAGRSAASGSAAAPLGGDLDVRCRELEAAIARYKGVIGDMRDHIEVLESERAAATALKAFPAGAAQGSAGEGEQGGEAPTGADGPAAREAAAYRASAEVMLSSLASEREALCEELGRANEYISFLQASLDAKEGEGALAGQAAEECALLRRHVRSSNQAAASARNALRVAQAQLSAAVGEAALTRLQGSASAAEGGANSGAAPAPAAPRGGEPSAIAAAAAAAAFSAAAASKAGERAASLPVDLAAELLQVREDCAALRGERDGLLELSNSLRCQVSRLKEQLASAAVRMANGAHASSASSSSSASSLTAARITQLEAALEAVSSQNKVLQGDLQRLLVLSKPRLAEAVGSGEGNVNASTHSVFQDTFQWLPVEGGASGAAATGSGMDPQKLAAQALGAAAPHKPTTTAPATPSAKQQQQQQQQQQQAAKAIAPQVLPMRPSSSSATNAQQQLPPQQQSPADAKAKVAAQAAQRAQKVPNYAALKFAKE